MVNILYVFSGGYESISGTSICSACNNNPRGEIRFFVIEQGLSESEKNNFKSLVESYENSIRFYNIDDIKRYFNFDFDSHGWHPIVLARLLVGSFLPKTIKRVIYLDGDTLVRNNLNPLFNLDLEGKILGMSAEPTIELNRLKKIHLDKNLYCNSGVILIDLEKWRDGNYEKKLMEFYKKHHSELHAPDQDTIMLVMKKQIKIISPRYNFGSYYDVYPYKLFCKRLASLHYGDIITEADYIESIKNPVVVHFLGEDNPWRKKNTHRFTDEYKKYQKLTPWKNTEDVSGWEVYYIFWKIFNIITKAFPSLRLWIINSLIPMFHKFNSKKLKEKYHETI